MNQKKVESEKNETVNLKHSENTAGKKRSIVDNALIFGLSLCASFCVITILLADGPERRSDVFFHLFGAVILLLFAEILKIGRKIVDQLQKNNELLEDIITHSKNTRPPEK